MKKIFLTFLLSLLYISNANALWWHVWIPDSWLETKIYTQINYNIEWPYSSLEYKELSNWIIFSYKKDNSMYINLYWKVYWPYSDLNLYDYWNDKYLFSYILDWKSYLNINWDIKWPYNYNIINVKVSGNSYYYDFYKDSERYVNLDWDIYWPINGEFRFFDLWENNKSILFWYNNNHQFYVNNELVLNNYVYYADKLDNNIYYYTYKKDENFYINIKWKEYWPYDDVAEVKSLWNNWFIFTYYNKENFWYNVNWENHNTKYIQINKLDSFWEDYLILWFQKSDECDEWLMQVTWNCVNKTVSIVNLNGKLIDSWDYWSIQWFLYNKWYIFYYDKDYRFKYVNINGKEYWPYRSLSIKKTEDNGFYFIYDFYNLDNKKYININGKEYWPYDWINLDNVYSTSEWNSFVYTIWDELYIIVNDKEYWPYVRNSYSFDYNKNLGYYFWYKKDNKFYINIKNKEYWPYINYVIPEVSNFWFSYIWETEEWLYFNLNWNISWPYNKNIWSLKLNNNWYSYWDRIKTDNYNWYSKETFIVKEDNSILIENKIKSNPKVDLLLNKIFYKIDKNWQYKANKVYEWLIIKLDTLLAKKQSQKNIELLEYIKYKVEDKLK